MRPLVVLLILLCASLAQSRPRGETIRVKTTGYCTCSICCGKWAGGPTASGHVAKGKLAAIDLGHFSFGDRFDIPGYGNWVPARDTGSKVVGAHLDLLFPTHAQAVKWGVRYKEVTVWRK